MKTKKAMFKVLSAAIVLLVAGTLFLSSCAVDPEPEPVTVKITITKDAAIVGASDYGVGIYITNTTTNKHETIPLNNPTFPYTYSYTKAKKGDSLNIWAIMGENNPPTNTQWGGSDPITVDTSAGGTISKDIFIKKF